MDRLVPFRKSGLSIAERMKLLEEQRRLFYVGITRTTDILVIPSFKVAAELAQQIWLLRLKRAGNNFKPVLRHLFNN